MNEVCHSVDGQQEEIDKTERCIEKSFELKDISNRNGTRYKDCLQIKFDLYFQAFT